MDAIETHRWHSYYSCTNCDNKYDVINRQKAQEAECTKCCASNQTKKNVSAILTIDNNFCNSSFLFIQFHFLKGEEVPTQSDKKSNK